jgi:hypothetical protein
MLVFLPLWLLTMAHDHAIHGNFDVFYFVQWNEHIQYTFRVQVQLGYTIKNQGSKEPGTTR